MAKVRGGPIEEELDELDRNLTRLRMEYDQYFRGVLRREPQVLAGKVMRMLQRFIAEAPKNSGQRFRFNQLNAKYQAFRQRWGRTMREIEAGTFKNHLFRMKTQENEQTPLPPEAEAKQPGAIDKLFNALSKARKKTGEASDSLSRDKLARAMKQQTEKLRSKNPNAKVRFRVVIEDNRAKLKASVR